MIWAVPLYTVDLITHRVTPGHKSMAFGVYLKLVTHDGPLVQTSLTGTGISTCYPSPTPLGLGLGPD